jgi:hypothetical protein
MREKRPDYLFEGVTDNGVEVLFWNIWKEVSNSL